MSLRKTIRTIDAANKRAARESARRERERARLQKQQEKHLAHLNAISEAAEHDAQVEFLVSFHKDCSEPFDWQKISRGPAPVDPRNNPQLRPQKEEFDSNVVAAQQAIEDYEPSFTDKLTRRVESRKQNLLGAVEEAKLKDEQEYKDALNQYQDKIEEYREEQEIYDLAKRIEAKDPEVYLEIAKEYFQTDGFSLELIEAEPEKVEIYLYVDDESVIPSEQKAVLKSGKLSVKKMPITKFWALYQDYVCSIAFRVGRETFGRLPVSIILVTVQVPMLNTQTGHKEEQPILSVTFSRQTFKELNFQSLDPSDAMNNFVNRMSFAARSGFKVIEPLSLSDFSSAG